MMEFNVARLNIFSPYYVSQDIDGDLLFVTDYGVKYAVAFEQNVELLNYTAFEFGIQNLNSLSSPSDTKLRDTILAIIEEFFLSNKSVLLYICETGDGMQEFRFRLFLRWFNTYKNRHLYDIRTIENVMDDDTPNFGAIIVEKTNPDIELIVARFNELSTFLTK